MKITAIQTIPLNVPLRPEVAIRSGRGGAHLVSPFLLVKILTDEGITGLGEASCTPRWSGEDQVTAAHLISTYLAPLLIGENPLNVETLAQKFRLGFAANYFTKASVEMALWDIAGKHAGKPVFELLGGKVRETVPTKWSVTGVAPDRAAEVARRAAVDGFKALKVKVGLDPDEDVARVQAVREAVGQQVKLGVDANGGWSTEVAAPTIARLRKFGIQFVEQPLPPEDIGFMADLRKQVQLPIVADESIYTLQDAITLARLGAADVLSIYIGKAGGIGPARKIVEFAQGAGLKCTLGSNLELGVGSAAMAHLAVATHGINAEEFPCDIIGPLYYEADIVREPGLITAGQAKVSDRPGLGIELDEEKVERYRVR